MEVEPTREPLRDQPQTTDRALFRLIALAGLSAEMRRRNAVTDTAVPTTESIEIRGDDVSEEETQCWK